MELEATEGSLYLQRTLLAWNAPLTVAATSPTGAEAPAQQEACAQAIHTVFPDSAEKGVVFLST